MTSGAGSPIDGAELDGPSTSLLDDGTGTSAVPDGGTTVVVGIDVGGGDVVVGGGDVAVGGSVVVGTTNTGTGDGAAGGGSSGRTVRYSTSTATNSAASAQVERRTRGILTAHLSTRRRVVPDRCPRY